MKKSLFAVAIAAVALASVADPAVPAEMATLMPRINPKPRKADFRLTERVNVNTAPICICCDDGAAVAWAVRHLGVWLGGLPVPAVSAAPRGNELPRGPEAYRLEVGPAGVRITANTLQGVRYALYTYRQTWEAGRGTARLTHYTAPAMTVDDAPAMAFRGIHFCWMPKERGVTSEFMEHQVRMAAYMKFNFVEIDNSGGIRSARHPEVCASAKRTVPMMELKRIADLARDLGVTVIPGMALLGHASLTGYQCGRHAALDPRPELQPLFEPRNGWNWCISNPHVCKLQQELMDELLEACGNPPYFHAGCDEAQPPSCSVCCATPYHEAVAAHLKRLHDHLKSRGVRMMMWHDMMLSAGDSRFKGFYCNGGPDADRILQTLPRDILICDWYYGGCWGCQETYDSYPTLDYFQRLGFDVVTCPWYNRPAAIAQSKWVRDHGQFGVLMTTWGRLGGKKYYAVWQHGPSDAWGTMDVGPVEYVFGEMDLATFWRQCGWDMGLSEDDSDTFGFVPATHPRIPESED